MTKLLLFFDICKAFAKKVINIFWIFQHFSLSYDKQLKKTHSAARLERFKASRISVLSAKERGRVALWQIKKVLHCHFADFASRISALCDPRKGVQYSIEEIVMAGIVLFLLKCSSRNAFNHKAKDVQFRGNYYRMFRLGLPHMDAVNELFEKMDTEAFEALRCRLLSSLMADDD